MKNKLQHILLTFLAERVPLIGALFELEKMKIQLILRPLPSSGELLNKSNDLPIILPSFWSCIFVVKRKMSTEEYKTVTRHGH